VNAPPNLREYGGRTGYREDEKAFREWCDPSGGDLSPMEKAQMFASLTCSHTNCGLRSIASGCDSDNEKLGDGSNYDLEILRKRDKLSAKAVEEGMWWLVVEAVVLERYPELVQLWSISRNTAGHVQQPVSEVTGMTLLYTEWALALEKEGEEPDYDTIVMQVTRGKPWWACMVQAFIDFLARHAGGETDPVLFK